MMTLRKPPSEDWRHRWRALRAWERVGLVVVLLGALVLSAALIYFRPGSSGTVPNGSPAQGATTAGPEFPPGTRWYYQRGQWVPQDQQEPVQP